MTEQSITPDIFPVLRYADGASAVRFLSEAFSMRVPARFDGPNDVVQHAELALGSGMIMLAGGVAPDDDNPWSTEKGGVYVRVDDVDAHYARARAAGVDIVRDLADTHYGAREYSARDIGGHLWSFGTYKP